MTRRHNYNDPDEPDARALWRYRAKLVDMLDELSWTVGNAPQEMQMPRESIHYLLKAAYHLIDVKQHLAESQDSYFIRSAIRELKKGLAPLGLGLDYWAKIAEWHERDLKEGGPADFLAADA